MISDKELRGIIRDVIKEELEQLRLKEAVEGPGYVIKAWDSPESKKSGSPKYNSAKDGQKYKTFEEVISALQSSNLSDMGAYEITWVKTGESLEEASRLAYETEPDVFEQEDSRVAAARYGENADDYDELGPLYPEADLEVRNYDVDKYYWRQQQQHQ